jgi:hypothetical protein
MATSLLGPEYIAGMGNMFSQIFTRFKRENHTRHIWGRHF